MAAAKCARCAGQGMLPCPPPWVPPNAGEWSSDGLYFRSCPDCNGSGILVAVQMHQTPQPAHPMFPVASPAAQSSGAGPWR
jgi:DnaJ-class molecular chaperone